MKIVLTRRAALRLSEIAAYLKEKNPPAALDTQTAIRACLDLLTRFPNAGRLVKDDDRLSNLRILAVPRRPYLIYYQVNEGAAEVSIITIRHTAQRRLP